MGAGLDSARQERAEAWQNRGRALGFVADTVRLWRPHILSVDLRGDDAYRSPVAERLATDVAAETDAHPLVRGRLATDSAALAVAIMAVSVAAGRVGAKLAWEQVPPGGGVVPTEIWLDTGKTPHQRSSGA